MNTATRLDYIDIAKGLGMLAIVWGHICCKGWSNELVYTFHIPIFFVISGMMYNKEKYTSFKTFFVRRFKRLIIPYAIYSVLTWCMWAALCYFTHKPVESYWMPLLQTLIAKGSGGYLVHNVALWFVPCLFVVDCIYYFLSKFDDYVTLVLCFIGAGISITFEYFYGKEYLELLPWNMDAGLMALPFYGIGNVFIHKVTHQRVVEFAQKNRSEVFGVSMILTIALYFTAVKWGGYIDGT